MFIPDFAQSVDIRRTSSLCYRQFKVDILRRQYGGKRVLSNRIYQECIRFERGHRCRICFSCSYSSHVSLLLAGAGHAGGKPNRYYNAPIPSLEYTLTHFVTKEVRKCFWPRLAHCASRHSSADGRSCAQFEFMFRKFEPILQGSEPISPRITN